MKLAEFFVTLGFEMEGAPELKSLKRNLDELASNAAKLLAIFASATAGMVLMSKSALEAADSLRKFGAATGLSRSELKSWQYTAKVTGTDARDLEQSIKSLQDARTEIMMGKGNVAPWQLLGIAPSENPFETMRALKDRIRELDPAIARNILGQMGISEGVFAMLRLSNKEFDELEKKYKLTNQQEKALNGVNKAWAELTFKIVSVRDSLVASLLPAIEPVMRGFAKIVGWMATFANWLSKDTVGAKIMRFALVALAAVIVIITGALTALITVIGLVTAAVAAFELVASPLLPILGAISAIILIVTGLVIALIFVIQDLWIAITGGESMIERILIKPFKELGREINKLIVDLLKFLGVWDSVKNAATWLYSKASGMKTLGKDDLQKFNDINKKYGELRTGRVIQPSDRLVGGALAPKVNNQSSSVVKQENNIEVNVEGGKDPYRTGQIIGSELKQQLSNAAYQMPVPMGAE